MSDQILWFATRGAGVVSLLLFTAVAILGILAVMRWQSPAWPRFLSVGLHRNLALLSVAFLLAHIVTAIVDPFTSLGPPRGGDPIRLLVPAVRRRPWRDRGRPLPRARRHQPAP